MALPADVILVPVTGTWLDGNGLPCTGKIWFSPMVATRLVDIATNKVIMPERFTVTLDATGSIPAGTALIATDQASLGGAGGFIWYVAMLLNDAAGNQLTPYTFSLPVPSGTVGSIVLSAPQYALFGTTSGLPAA